jgi:transcriptional regulator with XRE-family HTH domain
MATLYETIQQLCQARGIKGGKLCADLGISKGLLTDLKMGRRTGVSAATAHKIASYFGVSVGYLLGQEPLVNDDPELTEYLEALKTRPEMRMLFQLSKDASREDVEAAVRIIEALRNK